MFKIGGGLRPGCRIRGRRSFYCSDKRRREVRAYITQPAAAAQGVGPAQFVEIVGRDRKFPRYQLEEQHSQTVEVAGRRGPGPLQHFGGHIKRCACRRVPPRPLGVAAGAEIHQYYPAAGFAHDVVGLHVAMNQSGPVDGGERAAEVEPDEGRFARADRTAVHELLLERAAREQLHRNADNAVDDVRTIDGDDVRMPEPRHQLAFRDDAGPSDVVASAAGEQLEGDLAIQPDVARAVHHAEAALADLLDQLEAGPRREQWCSWRSSPARVADGGFRGPMQGRERFEYSKLFQAIGVARCAGAREVGPGDGPAVGDGLRQA